MFYKEILYPIQTCIANFGDRNAFCVNGSFYTYSQFGECISKIRKAVVDSNSKNKIVGIVINDDLETYSSIFALWLEGKAYVPLHPGWPIERCLDICDQVNLELILDSTEATRYNKVSVIDTAKLQNVEGGGMLEAKPDVSDQDLAYILFTSGSTGKPKGVQLMRKNISSFMNSFWKTEIKIDENDRCLQCFDLTFDVSIQCILTALTKGACLFTVPSGKIKYVCAAGLIDEYKLTFASMAPSMLRYLKPYFDEFDSSSMKQMILTAEACPLNLMEDFYEVAQNVELYDFYGPTETTIYCTYYKLTRNGNNKTLNGIISIGKPLANCLGLILDENGNELPVGEKGELCIAGDQVTCGYFNNPEKNAESFFTKEINGNKIRFYHTGDLCYMDADGDIMYSGRLDHQAKIQGFRVELGEIEYHARVFLKNTNVVCLPYENATGLTEIAMFIESKEFDNAELVKYMRSKMPGYMIPKKYLFEPSFPLNSSDKIDRKKLKEML